MIRDVWDGFTGRVKLAERKRLNSLVIERDESLCILTGKPGDEVAHIIPRSHGGKNSPIIWQEKNMCVVSREEHLETRGQRVRLFKKMRELYGYDYSSPPFAEYLIEDENEH